MSQEAIPDFSVRLAGYDDSYEMWVWWNDPTTRQMMKLNGYVPWEDHVKWYSGVLEDPKKILLMVVCRFGKIGVIRHDEKGAGVFETSIHFNPLFRGRGLGAPALKLARTYLLKHRAVKAQFATLKMANHASRKSFENAGYLFGLPPGKLPGLERFDPQTELFCLWAPQPDTPNV